VQGGAEFRAREGLCGIEEKGVKFKEKGVDPEG
jgi:hypothetical protein